MEQQKPFNFKFKKGDKIYHDGSYGRAIWRIQGAGEGMGREPYYLAQMIKMGPKGWKNVRGPFIEVARVVEPDFAMLSEAPEKWAAPKDPMASLMRMMKPLDPLNKFKLIK